MKNAFGKKAGIVLLFSIFILLLFSACSYQPIFSSADITSGVVITDTRKTIEFTPASGGFSDTGLLFYPGGLVDSHVYDEILSDFTAASGITAVVVKMPANLAVFAIDSGIKIIDNYPEIKQWVIAGHSLGGAMAASTVKNNPTVYQGLILMDSYPPEGDNLQEWAGAVLSFFSSVEKINEPERMRKTDELLPPATWLSGEDGEYPDEKTNYTVLHMIDGGSHSYFGTYGPQDGDYTPTIPREDFHAEVVDYMIEFFTENGWREAE